MIRPYFWSDVLENIRPPRDNEWDLEICSLLGDVAVLTGRLRTARSDLLLHADGHRGLLQGVAYISIFNALIL